MRASLLSLFGILILVPCVTFAFSIEPRAYYKDVRRTSVDAVGINLLTSEGIVHGHDADHFLPTRQINRAEFLKMIFPLYIRNAAGSEDRFHWYGVETVLDEHCFPDVSISQWFGPSICEAKYLGFVSGFSDGYFHPEQTVSYGEALKMLTKIFDYTIPNASNREWAEPYYQSASNRGVDLPIRIRLDTLLTRGRAARLAAAFLAESQGKLEVFRRAEAGQYSSFMSSQSSAASPSSSSSSASSLSSSTSAALQPLFTVPVTSHFLVVGETSDAIADVVLQNSVEALRIVSVKVLLTNEAPAIDVLELVRRDTGTPVATLKRRNTTDTVDYKRIYEVQVPLEQQVHISAGSGTHLVVRAVIRAIENLGVSEQLVQVRSINITMQGEVSNETVYAASQGPFPAHQTSFGRIISVQNLVGGTPLSIGTGSSVLVAKIAISGSVLPQRNLLLEQLIFLNDQPSSSIDRWQINRENVAFSLPCSTSDAGSVISCPNLQMLGGLEKNILTVFEVRARVQTPQAIRIRLAPAGSPSELGSVQWTDESGHFRWREDNEKVSAH